VERQQTTLRFDPFRELDRLTQPIWNARPSVPLEVFRKGENFVIRVDLPGIDPTSSDLTVNQDVLTDHRRAFLDASGRR
jgi:HSP20 family protein